MGPLVSVIIPHYQDLANLDQCLARLSAQTTPRERFEIIVVDNMSPVGLDAVKGVVGERARVVLNTERGAGPTRNAGVGCATAPILAFTDSDCEPALDWVERALEGVRNHPDKVIGGRVTVLPEVPGRLSPVEAFEVVFAFRFDKYIREKQFTGSGNMVVRKEIFDRVGGFRQGVSEDVDWSHRAVAQGFEIIYDPTLVVGHPARRTWKELVRKFERLSREGYLLAREKPFGRLRWFLRSLVVFVSPIPHAVKLVTSPRLPRLADRISAVPILVGIRIYRFCEMNRLLLFGNR